MNAKQDYYCPTCGWIGEYPLYGICGAPTPFCRRCDGDVKPMVKSKKEQPMSEMSIEEAIEIRKRWDKQFTQNPEDLKEANKTLLRVAEAWRDLYDRAKQKTENGGMSWPYLVATMDKILNPAPKSDIERVREWAMKHRMSTPGRYEQFDGKFFGFLDQLEKEKADATGTR